MEFSRFNPASPLSDELLAGIDKWARKTMLLAGESAAVILKKREEMDRDGRKDDTLVIVAGENHSYLYNHLYHMLTLQIVQRQERSVCIGYECEHDVLDKMRKEKNRTEGVLPAVHDPMGHLVLKAMASVPTMYVPHLTTLMSRFFIEKGFPVFMGDASYATNKNALILDPANSVSTRRSIGNTFSNFTSMDQIDGTSREGWQIREDHMAQSIVDYANGHKPRIIYQKTGNGHVPGICADLGVKAMPFFSGQKLSVLAMPIHDSEEPIPLEQLEEISDMHEVRGMPQFRVILHRIYSDLFFEQHEAAYLEKVFEAVQVEDHYLAMEGVAALRKEYGEAVVRSCESTKVLPAEYRSGDVQDNALRVS